MRCGLPGFRKENYTLLNYNALRDNDPGMWPISTPGHGRPDLCSRLLNIKNDIYKAPQEAKLQCLKEEEWGSVTGPFPASIDACTKPPGHARDYTMDCLTDIHHRSSCCARPNCCKLLQRWGLLRTRQSTPFQDLTSHDTAVSDVFNW